MRRGGDLPRPREARMEVVKQEYKLSDAVNLFVQQTNIKISLWGIYVAATFAAAGFSISSVLSYRLGAFVMLGFWTFTLAHFYLLFKNALILISLKEEIKQVMQESLDKYPLLFGDSLTSLVNMAGSPWIIIC